MALNWTGDRVTKRLRAAQIEGVNATLAAAAAHAKRNHSWQNRTATLEGSIDVTEFAAVQGAGVRGQWGSRDVRYALIQELGGEIRPRVAKALTFQVEGEFVTVQRVTIPARPYLAPAAAAEYPKLAQRIARAYERGAA